MVFASLVFLYVFLPLNLILYYAFKNKVYRNTLLTLFSFVFYGWGEPVWISLLVFSAGIDYFNAKLVTKYRGTNKAKLGVILSVVLNLSLLGIFKYTGFIYENINAVFSTDFQPSVYALPIGISFYTFQTISYVIDVYRGEIKAEQSFHRFLMYVSLYPQLVAGPIVRYAHIANEIDHRVNRIKDISRGMMRFNMGLFKKVIIANIAGEFAKQYMDGSFTDINTAESWFGILMFSVQIYFDFSGYSDMAIGLGMMFGFHYHENFKYPYISRSATEFWRRWHISLGSFFRDYVYIPLGGNKKNGYRNLIIVWFLTGLWHGANWNFVLWGLYFGLLILLERLFLNKFFNLLPRVFSHFYLLFAAVMGWVLFYFTDMNQMWEFIKLMFGGDVSGKPNMELYIVLQKNMFWLILTVILCLPVFPLVKDYLKKISKNNAARENSFEILAIVFSISLLLISTAMLVGSSYNPFLYFRF
jgi:alginate O-acetyltransferase complex protein AlgI